LSRSELALNVVKWQTPTFAARQTEADLLPAKIGQSVTTQRSYIKLF
jgi:hypothetical protein